MLSRFPALMIGLALLASVPVLRAEAVAPATDASLTLSTPPAGGESLLAAEGGRAAFVLAGKAAGSAKWTDLPDGSWRMETAQVDPPASVQLRALSVAAVKVDDVGWVRFRARCLDSADETGGRLRVAVQNKRETPPNAQATTPKDLVHELNLSPEWREYALPYTSQQTVEPGELELVLNFGHSAQTVELSAITWLSFGRRISRDDLPRTRFSYAGREEGAPWRAEAEARIAQHRQGDFRVKVVDANGKPMAGAQVKVELQRHAFGFGTAVKMVRVVGTTPDDQRYRETLLGWFSAAGPESDLKWPYWVKDSDVYNREVTLAGLRWLKAQGMHARGHVLVWPSWPRIPASVAELRGTPREGEIPGKVREHIEEILTTTRGLLAEWDVMNEPYTHHDLMDVFGPQIAAEWFKVARKAAGPDVPLYLNDFGNHDQDRDPRHVAHFEKTVRELQAAGAPLDGLGLQAHFGTQVTPPTTLLATLDRLARLGLPMRITEFDVTTDDEELQADYMRDFLTAVFSHPSMVGFQMWGFWEGTHWKPQAAMFRTDWSERPQAGAYRRLVLERWRTRLQGTSGADGSYGSRGFFGDYEVSVETPEGRITKGRFALTRGDTGRTEWTLIVK